MMEPIKEKIEDIKRSIKFTRSINTITTKLLMLFLFMTIIPLIALAQFSTELINSSMAQRANSDLALIFKLSQDNYEQALKNLKNLMIQGIGPSIEESLVEYYRKGNNTALLNRLKNISRRSDLSFLFIVSRDKKLIASAYSSKYGNKIESFSNLIDKALEKEEAVSSTEVFFKKDSDIVGTKLENQAEIQALEEDLSYTAGLSEVTTLPIYVNQDLVGIAIAGKLLAKDYKLVDSMSDLTGATVMYAQIINDGRALVVTTNLTTDRGNRAVGKIISANIVKELYTKKTIQVRDWQVREYQLANYYPLIGINGIINGIVYIGIPEDQFTMLAQQNIKLLAIISVAGLFAAIFLSAVFSRSITTPILKLAEAASKISQGDLSIRVNAKGSTEISQMGETFNSMAENLQREERLRDDFVATLTHDLKVPLLAESKTITFMLKGSYGDLNEEQKEVLEIIKNTNELTLDMVNTLLEVYRYDAGKNVLLKSMVNIVEVIKETLASLKALAEGKKVDLAIENSSPVSVFVEIDEREIKRVIHNLVANAISSTLRRGNIIVSITVPQNKKFYGLEDKELLTTTLKEPVPIENMIIVGVHDSGIGIEKEDMENLFKRFSGNKGRKPSSTGLGLYYSHQVISAHGGIIWAESEEEVGSIFKFTLPRPKPEDAVSTKEIHLDNK